jgi:hypothetical protein
MSIEVTYNEEISLAYLHIHMADIAYYILQNEGFKSVLCLRHYAGLYPSISYLLVVKYG